MPNYEIFTPHSPESISNTQYLTIWGSISFEELYNRTKPAVANTLKRSGFDANDIDDCLQSAYLKVWMKLQSNPEMFADKSFNFIVRSIFFHSKVQRFNHRRHQQKISTATTLESIASNGISIGQLEAWVDLQTAIVIVSGEIQNNSYALFALYSLITQAKVSDIQQLLGCSSKTMSNYRNRVREQLKNHLPHYNDIHPEKPKPFDLSPNPIADILLESFGI